MALSRDWGKEKREESFTLPWGAGAGISVAVSGYLGIWVSVCELEPKWFRMNPMIALHTTGGDSEELVMHLLVCFQLY